MIQSIHESDAISPYGGLGLNELGHSLFEKGKNKLCSNKKFGLVILSGGEGTRLGLSYPKGLFEIHGKNLFEWHLERAKSLHEKYKTQIYLFIMTSDSTHEKVSQFFNKNSFPFLKEVEIFKQNSSEVMSLDRKSKIFFKGSAVKAPTGNGDFFESIQKTKNAEEIDVFNVISVDNVLANVFDEVFVGAFYSKNLDILSKAIKAKPNESVGAFFKAGDYMKVIEYSESSRNTDVSPLGNICNHMFSGSFVMSMKSKPLEFHEAKKKIPYTDENGNVINPTEPNGIKKEKFIFDSFAFTTKNDIIIVPRELEFSPLKNNSESVSDNIHTCSKSLLESRMSKAGS